MDKLAHYSRLLEELVIEWGGTDRLDVPDSTVEDLIITDRVHGIYMLMSVGWRNNKRIQSIPFQARIVEDKIWVEWDGTDPSITEELLHRGVPREDLVLGWQSPSLRAMMERAAGD